MRSSAYFRFPSLLLPRLPPFPRADVVPFCSQPPVACCCLSLSRRTAFILSESNFPDLSLQPRRHAKRNGALIRVPGSGDVDFAEAAALIAFVVGNAGLATAGGMCGTVCYQMRCTSLDLKQPRQDVPAQSYGLVLAGASSTQRCRSPFPATTVLRADEISCVPQRGSHRQRTQARSKLSSPRRKARTLFKTPEGRRTVILPGTASRATLPNRPT